MAGLTPEDLDAIHAIVREELAQCAGDNPAIHYTENGVRKYMKLWGKYVTKEEAYRKENH